MLWRVGSSFLGPFKPDFMAVTMSSPDLYGPFWIATTLIFVTAGGCSSQASWGVGSKGPPPPPLMMCNSSLHGGDTNDHIMVAGIDHRLRMCCHNKDPERWLWHHITILLHGHCMHGGTG